MIHKQHNEEEGNLHCFFQAVITTVLITVKSTAPSSSVRTAMDYKILGSRNQLPPILLVKKFVVNYSLRDLQSLIQVRRCSFTRAMFPT